MSVSDILIRGAREHNLRDVNLLLPRNRLICFTGVSGSGKSSLAFDTLYAEGQRRYVQSLSSFARQFLGQMPKPDVDLISGLNPAISISQKAGGQNPRSTVGTITEIYDYLRVLYARVGTGHCPQCGRPITAQTRDQIIDRILALPAGTQFLVLAPLVRGQKGEHRDLFADLLKQGFVRARVDGRVVRLSDDLRLDRQMRHTIEVVVDRLAIGSKVRSRLAEAVESALRLGDGNLMVAAEEGDEGGGRNGGGRRSNRRHPRLLLILPPSAFRPPSDFRCPPTTPARTAISASSRRVRNYSASTTRRGCASSAAAWGKSTPSIRAADSRSGPLVSTGLRRIGRLVEGDGPLAAAHLSRRGRNARTQLTACRRARCSKRPGRNSTRSCNMPCSGAPATSTSRSPGGAARRATSGAESSRGSSPSCSRNTAPPRAACSDANWKSTCACWTVAVATARG